MCYVIRENMASDLHYCYVSRLCPEPTSPFPMSRYFEYTGEQYPTEDFQIDLTIVEDLLTYGTWPPEKQRAYVTWRTQGPQITPQPTRNTCTPGTPIEGQVVESSTLVVSSPNNAVSFRFCFPNSF